ncbi:MAG TPA: LL-diaminopimelate aminotransferase [Solirubrobacteraceae bacterium]|jgi:LL-diaminopimelate aminotransferase
MRHSERLERIPPYLFAQLERKIADKRAAGIDVITLGIGDPDVPTFPPIVEAAQRAVANPSTHTYPSNRGREEFREAVASFYGRRFGVELEPDGEVMPALGAKECIFNLNIAFLDPDDVALAADPGYPVYTGGPLLAGARAELMPLVPELGFIPDLDAVSAQARAAAKLLFVNYPNNPTGAIVADGFFERLVEFGAANDILIVHDNAYSETTYGGYVAPSFLETPGAKDVGVEVFSLSKGYNMTGWRCAAIVGNRDAIASYWRLKTNVDSGLFEAVQLTAAAALSPQLDEYKARMNEIYERRRDLVCDALARIGVAVTPPRGTIYIWAPVPDGYASAAAYCEHVLEEAAVVLSPGGAYGPNGEGFFRISLTTPDDRLEEAVERLGRLSA